MTLSEFAMLSTAISGIAVTVSLIYLAIQTRQNVRHTRALIQQGATARTTAIGLAHQNSDSSAAWIEGNGGKVSGEAIRKVQFRLMCQTAITVLEDLYAQHNDGLLSEEAFARNCAMHRGFLSEPGLRAYWATQRPEVAAVAPNFSAFVDGLCVGDATEFRFRL